VKNKNKKEKQEKDRK